MLRTFIPTVVCGLLVTFALGVAQAQDFRVYTTIQDLTAKPTRRGDSEKHPVIGRSRTLFHANKVYDYIPEIDEVVVIDFNTNKRHFNLLNTRREMTAEFHFDEVKKKLQEAFEIGNESIAKMEAEGNPRNFDAIALYRFQAMPEFDERFLPGKQQLTLKSRLIQYDVQCAAPPQFGFVEAYCRYADAICRLNYVLHPSVLTPEPRMKLNEALIRNKVLPTTVQLDVNQAARISRLATHQFRWELDQSDRQSIDHWESMIASPATRRVPVQDYQAEIVRVAIRDRK